MLSKDFLSLMSYSALMIGNSSAGIREAPSFKLPVIKQAPGKMVDSELRM